VHEFVDEPDRVSRGSIVAVLIGLAVGGVVAITLFMSAGVPARRQPSAQASPTPQRGLACPHLRASQFALNGGDMAGTVSAVTAAAAAGLDALDTSGKAFGLPERLALELEARVSGSGDAPAEEVEALLARALAACDRLRA
jgi:hypothetical protein